MKMIFALITILFVQVAQADNYVRTDDPSRGFELKASCEAGGHECQKVDGLQLDVLKSIEVEVDDESKPTYELKSNIQPCETMEACETLRQAPGFCGPEHMSIIAPVGAGGFEAYCTKVLGYEKKMKKQVTEDAVKKAAKAAAAVEKAEIESKQSTIRQALRSCIQTFKGTPTADQRNACILQLLKNALRSELSKDEL